MSSSLLLTQKDQIHCPYCYRKVKHWGGLASHIQWSLACQVKCDNNNPQLPRTSHDPILTPNRHDTPPGHQDHATQCQEECCDGQEVCCDGQEVCRDGLELEWDHGKFWAVGDYCCRTSLGKPDSTECGLPSHPNA